MKKMMLSIRNFWNDEEGLGTLEIILIAAVLVGIALIFRTTITDWVNQLLDNLQSDVLS